MATSNFHNKNASAIFAVEIEDEWAYDDLVENLESEFNKHSDYYGYGKSDPNELRSFPSKSLGSFANVITIGEDTIDIFVTPVIRNGYYGGCNLDWNVEYCVNGYNDDTYSDDSKTLEVVNNYVEFIENTYSQYSQPLGVFATFSNGETLYHLLA
jgi:hypothetical protein